MDPLGPMSHRYSSGSPLLWKWIIEYLSSFPEIDTSIITSMDKYLSLGVCYYYYFGCYNFSLFSQSWSVDPPVLRAAFPPSLSCDVVLNQILEEVPFQNLKKAAPEVLRWVGHSFIKHKRATLPECSLEKDDPVSHGDENVPPSWSDDNDDKKGNQEVGVVGVNHGSLHNYLQLNAKKSKQNATPSCNIQSVEELPIHLHGDSEQLEEESRRIMKVTEIEGNNLGKDSQRGEGDKDLRVASRTHGRIDAVGLVELLDNQMENVQNDDVDVMGPSGDAGVDIDQVEIVQKGPSADRLQRNIDHNVEKADMVHPCPEEIFGFEDEIFNNVLKKNLFLSSHHIPSQDPVQKAGWKEQKSCVKCNQNGQVLACSASGCPLVVHESCLNSAARFDDKCNFLCPFCAYSVSISKYLEAKDKTLLARKKLVAFIGLMGKLAQERRRFPRHLTINGNENLVVIRESKHLGREHEHQQQSKLKSCDDHPTTENTETDPVNQVEVERDDILKESVKPQTTHACQEHVNSDGEGSSIGADDKFIISSYTREPQTKFSFPPTRQLTRKIVPRTNVEEGMLRVITSCRAGFQIAVRYRDFAVALPSDIPATLAIAPAMAAIAKGVEEFANDDGTIPWKRILEFGSKVFPKDKTAQDLKNKWRCMRKGFPKLQLKV
ncbi:hypothetical protein F3Y22_tig00110930pilonHSYRG00132 [Hibiscus syriacus]|uniref:Zinc finger PHD-type domain-containing protein n=1 Tax=Hibiscus syriacus TaxID=106335 RepID=A0A6A2ZGB3_HIBSY|nr:hypothetical protein F3Y22_tig00110930pilonHSYRG00132 [Hibiscus syriacus]